ncbi:MAG: AAC(3) family N-acetyltransferase [Oceanospirillaceae bacterium]|nr:AAC(3) family N-acetyltransferase [Oceanospirillaceae bacterium]
MITRQRLIDDLQVLGVKKGDTINVKASLASIGKVDGGAVELIEALISVVGEEGTIITDSFIDSYQLPLNRKNKVIISSDSSPSYAGALANAMINHPMSVRSKHPIQKFAAIGKRANELMLSHDENSYAYDVLRKITHTGGKNLKIGSDEKVYGFGTTHVAIGELGYRQKAPSLGVNFQDNNGNVKLFKRNWAGAGHGFNKLVPYYQQAGAIINQGYVGFAPSKLTDMSKTFEVEMRVLSDSPGLQLCDDMSCVDCQLSWNFSDASILKFLNGLRFKLSPSLIYRALKTRFIYKYHG